MRRVFALASLLAVLLSATLASAKTTPPWWREQKIRLFWGQWHQFPKSEMSDVIKTCADVGATVWVTGEARADEAGPSGFDLEHARIAHNLGIKYFACVYGSYLRERSAKMNAPLAVNAAGEHFFGYQRYTTIPLPCPVYEPLYMQHMLDPMVAAAKSGLVDGVLLDWEPYERPEVKDVCFCEHCFTAFARNHKLGVTTQQIGPKERYPWLREHKLDDAYTADHTKRRLAIFNRIRDGVHKIRPDFIFAGYDVEDWNIAAGLHSPNAPYMVVDQRHYWDDPTRPWWRSYHEKERKLGYLHIAGSYDITFHGFQPESQVGASRWMYESAVNTDGTWLWFGEEPGPEMWRSYWTANRRLKQVEQKLGDFLFKGKHDLHFALPVERTGDPALRDKIVQRTYHLGGKHLTHINNVDADRPMVLRVRFAKLPAGTRWSVTDPIANLTYSYDQGWVTWTAERLSKGVMVSLENRSDLFLLLSPVKEPRKVATAQTIAGDISVPTPNRPKPAEPAPVTGKIGPLIFTKTADGGFVGGRGDGWSMSSAIFTSGDAGSRLAKKLPDHLWTPSWSPDSKRIAFCRYADGRGQIYLMNPDGTGVVNLSNNKHCDRSPVWSPDSKKMAFVSDRGGAWDICVMNADGSGQHQLTSKAGFNDKPEWSRDGRFIAYDSTVNDDADIWVMNANGTGKRALISLPGDQREPTWSPDGATVAFTDLGWFYPHMSTYTIKSGKYTPYIVGAVTYVGGIKWSPDGSRIAGIYRRNDYDSTNPRISGIFCVTPDAQAHLGNEPEKYTLAWGKTTMPLHGGRRDPGYIPTWYAYGTASPRWIYSEFSGLTWSPDSKNLAFSANIVDDGRFHVYTVSVTGGEPVIVPGSESAWPQGVDWGG